MNRIIKQAFTLIELLVVIAIIGILSGLIIVSMNGITDKANIAKAQVFSNSLRNSLMLNLIEQYNFNDIADVKIGTVATAADIKDSWGTNNSNSIGATGPIIRGGTDCVTGKCLQFNGPSAVGDPQVGDYVQFPNTNYPVGDNPITIEAWVNIKQNYASTVGILGAAWNDPSQLLIGNLTAAFGMYDNLNAYHTYAYDRKNLTLNSWYHIAGTYSNSSIRICLNGDCETWACNPLRVGPGYPIYMGAKTFNYLHFNGLIDDGRIYNAAIPVSQIKENYYAGLNSLLTKGNINTEEYSERINLIANE